MMLMIIMTMNMVSYYGGEGHDARQLWMVTTVLVLKG